MEFRHRGRFKIIHAKTDEHLATFHCEEGHRSVGLPTLREALPQHDSKSVSIDKVVWDDYDEVTVFVKARKRSEDRKDEAKEKRVKRRRKRRKRR